MQDASCGRSRRREATAVACAAVLGLALAELGCRAFAQAGAPPAVPPHPSTPLVGEGSTASTPEPGPAPSGPPAPPTPPAARGERAAFKTVDGKRVLFAGGTPFLVLATQAEAWRMNRPDETARRQFAFARALGSNTFAVQVKWAQVEPRRDAYSMDWIRWVLDQARAQDLKLALLWFGSNVVGKTDGEKGLRMVPEYVSGDTTTYSRVGIGLGGNRMVLDPADPDTLEREKRAFRRALEFVRSEDTEGRVILWQILNEVGVYPKVVVPYSDADLTRNLARYVEGLARLEKDVLGVPAYTNFWEGLRGADVNHFVAHCPSLDFVSPDVYGPPRGLFGFTGKDYDQFRRAFLDALDRFSRGRNVFFLAETNTDAFYRADLSLFTLLGKAGGLGMDVWAISTPTPNRGEPLVDAATGRLTASGEKLREVYSAVGAAMGPIAMWAGTRRAAWVVSEGGGRSRLDAGGFALDVDAQPGGALLAIATPRGDLAMVGSRARLRVRPPAGFDSSIVEEGTWVDENRWQAARRFPGARAVEGGIEIALDRYVSVALRRVR